VLHFHSYWFLPPNDYFAKYDLLANAFFEYQSFFLQWICLGFGVWDTQGSGGQVGRVKLVLRTFPELVRRSVQNLVEIGLAVRA